MNKNFIRIIPRLDIKNGQLIKGINLEGLRVLGDPNDFSKKYLKLELMKFVMWIMLQRYMVR